MHHHHQGFRVVLRCYQNGYRKFKTIRLGRISIFTSLYTLKHIKGERKEDWIVVPSSRERVLSPFSNELEGRGTFDLVLDSR